MARTETVTVLFTDLVGSTELASWLGHDAYEALRHEHFAAWRAALARHDGVEVKTTGDGLMVCFASAADAVGCAIALQQVTAGAVRRSRAHPLQLRIGISSGEATREEGDLYGPPVVEAARLCAAAVAEQILTSDVVRVLTRGKGHTFTSVGALTLKGLPEPVPACAVTWEPAAPAAAVPLPPRLATSPPFGLHGRAAEQEALARLWGQAREGQRQLALLAGEPGIGKTRLAAETARAAHRDGAVVLFGACDEDVSLPYRPFVEALRHYVAHAPDEVLRAHVGEHKGELGRLVPELGRRVPDLPRPQRAEAETERYLLFEAVTGLLAAASQEAPLVLLLDDLQWAAQPELLLLKHLLRSALPMRLLILGMYRDSDLTRTHPLAAVLADLRRESGVERLGLGGLDDDAVVALLAAVAGHELDTALLALGRAIRRETEGSPFFIGEVVRHLTEAGMLFQERGRWTYRGEVAGLNIPEGVKEVIGRRLARLSATTNKVLGLAAVIGRNFDLPLLTRIGDVSEDAVLDALDEAMAAALVVEVAGSPDAFAFRHALIRTTLYEEASGSRRARLHRKVGEALETLSGSEPGARINELAYHWLAATQVADAGKAIRYARQAGDRALADLAFEEAAAHYEHALGVLEPHDRDGEELRCDLLLARGDAQRRAGFAAYREIATEAAALARHLGDAERLGLAALLQARAGGWYASSLAVNEAIIALYEEASAALGSGDSILRARILAQLAAELVNTPQRERRHALAREALEIARRLGEPAGLGQVLVAVVFAINDPLTVRERLTLAAELDALSNELGSLELRFLAAYLRGVALLESGDAVATEQLVTRMEQLAGDLRQPVFAWLAGLGRAMLATMRGASDAEQLAFAAFQVAVASEQPDAASILGSQLAGIRRNQGRYGELFDAMRATATDYPHYSPWRAAFALLYCETDRLTEAREQFDSLGANGFDIVVNAVWAVAMHNLAEVCTYLRDADAAALLYPRLAPVAEQVTVSVGALCNGSLGYPAGLLATCLGRWEEAERHFAHALAMNERLGARPYYVRTQRGYAGMLLDRAGPGDAARAAALIAAGLAEAERLGMAREVVRFQRLREG